MVTEHKAVFDSPVWEDWVYTVWYRCSCGHRRGGESRDPDKARALAQESFDAHAKEPDALKRFLSQP